MNRLPLTVLMLGLLLAFPVMAQQPQQQMPPPPPSPEGHEGRYYFGLFGTNHHHRSLGRFNDRANTQGAGLVFGNFLTDLIRLEVRAGADFEKDKPDRSVELHVEYYASAYIGLYYPWSAFSALYAQFGVSGVKGEAHGSGLDTIRRERDEDGNENPRGAIEADFTILDENYIDQPFSPSFLLGIDFHLFGDAYFNLEGGRLHTDTVTGVQIWQYNAGIRYLF